VEGKTCNNSIGGKTYHTNLPNSTHSDGKIREECELEEFEKKLHYDARKKITTSICPKNTEWNKE